MGGGTTDRNWLTNNRYKSGNRYHQKTNMKSPIRWSRRKMPLQKELNYLVKINEETNQKSNDNDSCNATDCVLSAAIWWCLRMGGGDVLTRYTCYLTNFCQSFPPPKKLAIFRPTTYSVMTRRDFGPGFKSQKSLFFLTDDGQKMRLRESSNFCYST